MSDRKVIGSLQLDDIRSMREGASPKNENNHNQQGDDAFSHIVLPLVSF
jgi:hypothetical protein